MSVVSLYYYVKVLKVFLVFEDQANALRLKLESVLAFCIFALAGSVLALGLYPEPFIQFIRVTLLG